MDCGKLIFWNISVKFMECDFELLLLLGVEGGKLLVVVAVAVAVAVVAVASAVEMFDLVVVDNSL